MREWKRKMCWLVRCLLIQRQNTYSVCIHLVWMFTLAWVKVFTDTYPHLSLSLSPSSLHSQNHLHNYLDFHWKVLPDFHKVKSWRAFSTRIKNLTPVNLIIAIKANNKSWKLHLKIEFIYWVGSDFWGELTFYCWPFSCQKRENFRISFNFV